MSPNLGLFDISIIRFKLYIFWQNATNVMLCPQCIAARSGHLNVLIAVGKSLLLGLLRGQN